MIFALKNISKLKCVSVAVISFNIVLRRGFTVIIDDMSFNTEISVSTNSRVSIVSVSIVNLLNPNQLNMMLDAQDCVKFIVSCSYSVDNDDLVDGQVYLISVLMSDNTIKQQSFLYTK